MDADTTAEDELGPLPEWLIAIWGSLEQEIRELHDFMTVSSRAIHLLADLHDITPDLRARADSADVRERGIIEQAEKDITRARKLRDTGLPLLHAQATVLLWGFVESAVRDFLAGWLEREDAAMQVQKVADLKLSVADYRRMDVHDLSYHIVDTLDQGLKPSERQGVGRFENLLTIFGFGGPVDDDIRRGVLEVQNVRNAIAHRRARVDARFLKNCPWLATGMSEGDAIVVTATKYMEYSDILGRYVALILGRIRTRIGLRPITADDYAPRTPEEGHS